MWERSRKFEMGLKKAATFMTQDLVLLGSQRPAAETEIGEALPGRRACGTPTFHEATRTERE
jgi:hypothetical protein